MRGCFVHPLFSAKSVDGVRAYEMARKAYRAAQKGDGSFHIEESVSVDDAMDILLGPKTEA
ncbi:MAG: hypothetical protein KBT08_08115 [Bacteroidales bacterium]|nr:hypothetical protein [Candidatus Cryptobacteroides onthequi]